MAFGTVPSATRLQNVGMLTCSIFAQSLTVKSVSLLSIVIPIRSVNTRLTMMIFDGYEKHSETRSDMRLNGFSLKFYAPASPSFNMLDIVGHFIHH